MRESAALIEIQIHGATEASPSRLEVIFASPSLRLYFFKGPFYILSSFLLKSKEMTQNSFVHQQTLPREEKSDLHLVVHKKVCTKTALCDVPLLGQWPTTRAHSCFFTDIDPIKQCEQSSLAFCRGVFFCSRGGFKATPSAAASLWDGLRYPARLLHFCVTSEVKVEGRSVCS